MEVGEKIRNLRIKQGMTQETLADKINVSRPMITQIERGTRSVNVKLCEDIAKALGCKIEDLLK